MDNQTVNEAFVELTNEEAESINAGFSAANQAIGLINGIFNGGYGNFGLSTLAGQSIALTLGASRVPLFSLLGRPRFPWYLRK